MRTVRRRIYAAHLTVCRGIIEQLEQVEIDAFPTAFVTDLLTLGIIIGVMNEVASSDCPAGDCPPSHVDSVDDENNKRVSARE
jgi:hypothetical protein